jgi:hypothetical protein
MSVSGACEPGRATSLTIVEQSGAATPQIKKVRGVAAKLNSADYLEVRPLRGRAAFAFGEEVCDDDL